MAGWVILLLLADLLLVLVGLHLLVRRVLPLLDRIPHPTLVADVWAPLALVLPGLFLAAPLGDSVAGHGWVPVASAVCAAAFGAGLIFTRRDSGITPSRPRPRTWLIWLASGLLLLLLGAAHELTIWTGQCFFAVAAVVLWLNTPLMATSYAQADANDAERSAGMAMFGAFGCAIGHGILLLLISAVSPLLSGILAVGYLIAGCAGTAVFATAGWALRVVGWTAALGILLGAGLLSLLHLLPQAVAVILGLDVPLIPRVAHGFGFYSIEAVLLMVLAGVGWMLPQIPRSGRVVGGVLLAAAAGVITVLRLADMA